MPCANPCAGTRSAPGKRRTAPIPIKLYVWVYGIYKIFHPYFHALRYYIGFLGFPLWGIYDRDAELAVHAIVLYTIFCQSLISMQYKVNRMYSSLSRSESKCAFITRE